MADLTRHVLRMLASDEAESDTVFNEFAGKKGELVVGTVTRVDAGTAIVSLGKTEALLPRSEQIPGETHHVGERVKAVILEVRKQGHRVKVVLSRCHPDFVRSLFEEEIPEIDERILYPFGDNMFGGDFVFSVSRHVVRHCATPLLVMPGDDPPHPRVIGEEIIELAPNVEALGEWKGPEHLQTAVERVSAFLDRHAPQ